MAGSRPFRWLPSRVSWTRPAASIPGLALVLALALPALVRADNDWLGIEVPRPFDEGSLSLNVKLGQIENDWWQDGQYGDISHEYFLRDPVYPSNADIQDLACLDTRLAWRMRPRLVLELEVPTVFSEFSPYTQNVPQYYNVGSPGVYESQGLGDMRLGMRGALRDRALGFNAAWTLSVVAPTGLSPWSAPESLAATGAGRWQALPGFVVGGQSPSFEVWEQAIGCIQAGQQAFSSGQDYVSWNAQGGVPLPAGGLWLGPRYGGDSVTGLAWIWYRDGDARIALAAEARAHWLSPWSLGSGSLGLPAESSFGITPEMQARFGRFSALIGWQTAYIWAEELPSSNYGEILFDVAYTF